MANRIVTVGSPARAELIAKNFDADAPTKVFHSSRGFSTYTGYYHGTMVSVVAIGMVSVCEEVLVNRRSHCDFVRRDLL